MQKILIVEDEPTMRRALADLLVSAGYETAELDFDETNLVRATEQILRQEPNLVLLDINLPGINGELLLKNLREQSDVPVIMLTSSGAELDELLSMSYGADDYVTKPYNPQILLLRITAVLKRQDGANGPLRYRGLMIDLGRGVIEGLGKRVLLTKNEMIILGHLLSRQGEIVTRDELMADLWNNHEYINDNALTVNVSRVRAKLTRLGVGEAIETRKGLGYVLV